MGHCWALAEVLWQFSSGNATHRGSKTLEVNLGPVDAAPGSSRVVGIHLTAHWSQLNPTSLLLLWRIQ